MSEVLDSPPQDENDDQAAGADTEAEPVTEDDLEDTEDDEEGGE